MHINEWIQDNELPIHYSGISTCFRKESRKSGKDCWGIFRVHQFEKIEQFVITKPENSWNL
jgi:seryl-tRNA synthetase